MAPRYLHVHRQAVPAGDGTHLRTKSLAGLDELHGVAHGGALGQGARRERGGTGVLGRLRGDATTGVSADQQLRLQQRAARHMRADERQAIAQRGPFEGGEVVGSGTPGRRSSVEDGQGIVHAAASSAIRGT